MNGWMGRRPPQKLKCGQTSRRRGIHSGYRAPQTGFRGRSKAETDRQGLRRRRKRGTSEGMKMQQRFCGEKGSDELLSEMGEEAEQMR